MELTSTFMALLEVFRPIFTAPSHGTFRLLMTGWILSVRHRYVTDLIISSDSVGNGHFSDYHRFFSHAKWKIDDLWKYLTQLLFDQFVGPTQSSFWPETTRCAANAAWVCSAPACTMIR